MNCPEVGQRLDAFVDQELGDEDSASLNAHLATCAGCRERLSRLESLGSLVRRAPYYQAPAHLRAKVISRPRESLFAPLFTPLLTPLFTPLFTTRLLAWAASLALAASLGGAFVSMVRSSHSVETTPSIVDDVVNGHVRALMGTHLFDVRSTDQHTVKPWFLGKLDFSPPVADLAASGFPLVGGRLDYLAGRPVAALVYQRREHTINVFVWPAAEPAAPITARSIRGFQVQHWTRGGMTFWAVSDLNGPELAEFANELGR